MGNGFQTIGQLRRQQRISMKGMIAPLEDSKVLKRVPEEPRIYNGKDFLTTENLPGRVPMKGAIIYFDNGSEETPEEPSSEHVSTFRTNPNRWPQRPTNYKL